MFFDITGCQSFFGEDPFLKKIEAHKKAGIILGFKKAFKKIIAKNKLRKV